MKRELWAVGLAMAFGAAACAPTARLTNGKQGDGGTYEVPHGGIKARIAVARFTDRTGKGWWTAEIGDGMADMLATALFNTNRYVVLEREALSEVTSEQDLGTSGRVRQDTAARSGEIEGAELLVMGAVTEFEQGSGGGVVSHASSPPARHAPSPA